MPPPKPPVPHDPCYPSPCGSNARCRVENNYAICECIPDYHGNPYLSCRPECVGNPDCPMNRACIRQKCQDPCPGTCGVEAECQVINHIPICTCPQGTTGDAFRQCSPVVEVSKDIEHKDPCYPSPCGRNTVCRKSGNTAICECIPGFFGSPFDSGCQPECTISSDCARDKACVNNKCVDPCPGVCGYSSLCHTVNHSPICSCPPGMIGDPFVECKQAPSVPSDPCNPSPCSQNGYCRVVNGAAICTYPECITNDECSYDRACFNQKCSDPCVNACGLNAICNTVNHKPVCVCPTGYMGSPYVQCIVQREEARPKPECELDTDCSNDKACINQQCANPCTQANVCSPKAECHVQLHRPICVCPNGFSGNAQLACFESKFSRQFQFLFQIKCFVFFSSWM